MLVEGAEKIFFFTEGEGYRDGKSYQLVMSTVHLQSVAKGMSVDFLDSKCNQRSLEHFWEKDEDF